MRPVRIVEYDPAWPSRFRSQCDRVSEILAPWLATPQEHVGVTPVPGLAVKPVIGMLGPVRSLDEAQDAGPALTADGRLFWPDDPGRPTGLWFLRPAPAARMHHLQLIAHDDPHARALLAFRDALRADPGHREKYARLKRQLAGKQAARR